MGFAGLLKRSYIEHSEKDPMNGCIMYRCSKCGKDFYAHREFKGVCKLCAEGIKELNLVSTRQVLVTALKNKTDLKIKTSSQKQFSDIISICKELGLPTLAFKGDDLNRLCRDAN